MRDDLEVLRAASERAIDYVAEVDGRPVVPSRAQLMALAQLDEPLPELGNDPSETLQLLDEVVGPATVATTGPNYFGFVNGATYPVALGAAFLVNAWDQNAALPVMSPAAAKIHDITHGWLIDLLGLPEQTDVAFVTGATVANASCLAAARDALLAKEGWEAPRLGLFGAPEVNVVIGGQAHASLRKSLGLVGLGSDRVTIIPADDQGRMRADLLPDVLEGLDGPVLVCAQAGEVNTGAFDPFVEIADALGGRANAWLHVDGAFGLWALADPSRTRLVEGLNQADSWAADGHKWLNVTYDCGMAFVARPEALRRTFASIAGYLPPESGFEAMHHTPQSSQRARQIEVWSVLRTLGREGVAELVQRTSDCALTIGERLSTAPGFEVLNEVVLNQVLVRFGDGTTTEALIDEVQRDGRIWCGPTQWHDETAMRISVSSWKTTGEHAEAAAAIIIECAARLDPGVGGVR